MFKRRKDDGEPTKPEKKLEEKREPATNRAKTCPNCGSLETTAPVPTPNVFTDFWGRTIVRYFQLHTCPVCKTTWLTGS